MKCAAAAKLALGKRVVLLLPGRAPLAGAVNQLGPGWQRWLQCIMQSGGSREDNGAAWRTGVLGEQEAKRKAELQVLGH